MPRNPAKKKAARKAKAKPKMVEVWATIGSSGGLPMLCSSEETATSRANNWNKDRRHDPPHRPILLREVRRTAGGGRG
jgi:hypothetical protein